MVVQLVILPAGFVRFFPRWHMVKEEDLHSRVGVRERPAAPDRGAEPVYIDGEPELRQIFECVRFTEAATTQLKRDKNPVNRPTVTDGDVLPSGIGTWPLSLRLADLQFRHHQAGSPPYRRFARPAHSSTCATVARRHVSSGLTHQMRQKRMQFSLARRGLNRHQVSHLS
jgi:hypothetical protein